MKNILKNNIVVIASFFLLSNSYAAPEELRVNEDLPIMIDTKTELNSILLTDMTIIYIYQLKNITVDEAKKLKLATKYFIEHHACKDEQIQCLLSKDLNVDFVYKIADEEILTVKINKDVCLNLDKDNHPNII